MAFPTLTKDSDAIGPITQRWGADDWVTATQYYCDESYVRDPNTGYYYQCTEDHTSGNSVEADKKQWKRIKKLWLRRTENLIDANTDWVQVSSDPTTATALTLSDKSNTTKTSTILVAGGDVDASYVLRNRAKTDSTPNRWDDRSVTIKVTTK